MIIFHVVLNISVVGVVSDETIFKVISKTSVITDETISHIVSEISVVSVVSDEIIFHVVLNIGLVSVVSYETISPVFSKISVVNHECMLMCSPAKQRSQSSQYGSYFYQWDCFTSPLIIRSILTTLTTLFGRLQNSQRSK